MATKTKTDGKATAKKKPAAPKFDIEKARAAAARVAQQGASGTDALREDLERDFGLKLTSAKGVFSAEIARLKGPKNANARLAIDAWARRARRALLKAEG